MKQWLKRLLTTLCCALMGVTIAFGIAACGGGGSDNSSASSEHVHEYVETETQAATCQADGYKTLTCSCGDTKTETLQKLAHTEETMQAVPATCFSTGLTEGKRCSVCEEILVAQTQTTQLEHDFTKQDTAATYVATAATCQAKATYYYSCQHCGTAHDTNTFESGNFGACDFENAVHADYLKTKATCVKRAEYYKSCSVCHEKSETQTFFAGEKNTEHVWEESDTVEIFETVEVSCFQDGFITYKCKLCQKKYADKENLVLAPGKHTYTTAVTEPTCTEQGYTTYTCECGDSYSADYTDPAHKYTTTQVVDPTCSSQGYTLHICACEASYSDTYVAATGEHTSTERVSKEATCTQKGEKEITYTCACNKTVTEEIPTIPHDFKNVKVVAATCEEKGYTRHSCDCGEYEDDTFTAATGHLNYSTTVTLNATCTEAGVKRFDCDACEYYYEEEIEATGHTFVAKATVAPTCDEKGYTQYACDCGVEGDKKDFVDATGHNYQKGTEIQATCEQKGYTQYICQNDPAHQYHVETKALGHDIAENSWGDPLKNDNGEEILWHVEGCTYHRTYETICKRCEEKVQKTENVLKHNYTVKIESPANCVDPGMKRFTCTECQDTYTDDYSVSVEEGHQWQNVPPSKEYTYTHKCGIPTCTATKTVLLSGGSSEITVDKSALANAGEVQTNAATIKMDEATKTQLTGGEASEKLNIHASTLSETDKQATMSKLSEEEKAKLEGKDIFNFTVSTGDKNITQFDGKMTITVQYTLQEGEDAEGVAIWYIDDDGKISSIKAKYIVMNSVGYAVFETDHFSKYTVVRLTPSERCALYDHDIKVKTVEKTCTMDGYTMEYCIRCGYNNRKNVDETNGHTYTTKTVLPTCTKKGYTEYSCQLCDEEYCDNFKEANGHFYETETVAPTCTKQGYTKHTCTVEGCGNTYNSEFVNANGHDFETETVAPTCIEKGYTKHTCTVEGCGYTYQSDATPATGHSYVADDTINPTCTEKGYTKFKCHCGREYTGEYKPAKGHKYDNGTKQDATCQQEGCTVYKCENCDAFYEADKKPKSNHDYKDPVKHDPTCKENGYDRHQCKHCDHYYDDNFKDKTAHDYEEVGVKEPTCTEKGYTIYVCKDPKCGSTINGKYVEQTKHNYGDDFTCTECGELHPAAAVGNKGFYLTLHDSVINSTNYLVTLENMTITLQGNIGFGSGDAVAPENPEYGEDQDNNIGSDVVVKPVKPRSAGNSVYLPEQEVVIEVLKFSFGFDENGYVVGHGEFRVNVEYSEIVNGKEVSSNEQVAVLKAIFAEGKVYAFTGDTSGDAAYETYIVVSQEYMQTAMGVPLLELRSSFAKIYSEDARNIILAAMGVSNKTIDKTLEAVMDFFFVKAEAGEGYTFTLDSTQLYTMAEKLATKSVKELFDSFFGNGQLAKLFEYLTATLDKTVGGLETEIAERLEVSGYNLDDFYGIFNDFFGMIFSEASSMADFDLKAFVAEYAEYNIGTLISDMTDMPVEEMKEMLSAIEQMCETDSIVSILLQVMGEVETADQAEEMIAELLDMIKDYLKYIGETSITISTDKEGNAQSMRLKLDINIDTDSFMAVITGNGSITFNDTYELNFAELQTKLDNLLDTLKLKDGMRIEGDVYGYTPYVVYRHKNGILFLPGYGDLPSNEPVYFEEMGTEEVEGVTYLKYKMMWDKYEFITEHGIYRTENYGYYYEESYGIMTGDTCGDWINYGLNCRDCEVYFNVWVTADGEIYKFEIDWEETQKNLGYTEALWVWYNPKTEAYKQQPPHDYRVVDSYHTEKCGETSFEKYECYYCKKSYVDQHTNEHHYQEHFELFEGATSCEDGYASILTCRKCDYEEVRDAFVGEGHQSRYETIRINTQCGEVELFVYGCACGYDFNLSNVGGACMFETYGEEGGFDNGGKDDGFDKGEKEERGKGNTWICRTCGDTITYEQSYEEKGCYRTYGHKVLLNGVPVVEKSFQKADHMNIETTEETDVNGIITSTTVCHDCEKVISVYKMQNGTTIYYKNENGFGFIYEIVGCNYVRYVFTPTERFEKERGERHAQPRVEYTLSKGSESCLDGVDAVYYCSLCDELLYKQYNVMEQNHSYNMEEKEFITACGSVTLVYGVCACGEETIPFDQKLSYCGPIAVGCVLEMDMDAMAYVCKTCGFKLAFSMEQQEKGCTQVMEFTLNAYQGGTEAIWTLGGKYSYTHHYLVNKTEKDKDGNTVNVYGCENCSYFEYKRTVDQYGRELRYERANGSGYYYEYHEDCSYDYYEFDKYGNEEKISSGKKKVHVTDVEYFFLTGIKDCNQGVQERHYCILCDEILKSDIYYGCQVHEKKIYETETDCGSAYFVLYACACGRQTEDLQVGKSSCGFNYMGGYSLEDTEAEYGRYLESYQCMKCGYTYTRYTYSTKVLCTNYYYTVYSFGVNGDACEYSYTVCREDAKHEDIRFEEGATVDGAYTYERYCDTCKTWFEHYAEKRDEYGRQVYYMNYLTGQGVVMEFVDNCEYVMYDLDIFGNKSNPEAGISHAQTSHVCELMEGSKTCEDGIYVKYICAACGETFEQVTSQEHRTFDQAQKIQTHCGTVYVRYAECACGEVKAGSYLEGSCECRWSQTEPIDDDKLNHQIVYNKCFVTECTFSFTQESYYYYEKGNGCKAICVNIFTYYLGETKVFERETSWIDHKPVWKYEEETDKYGNPVRVHACEYCSYVQKWDCYGREIYYWNPYENRGYEYILDGCNCLEIRNFDDKGITYVEKDCGIYHAWVTKDIQQACTQYGTAIKYCRCCGVQDEYEYVEPGHDYYRNEELNCYVCSRCGLENEKNVDGFFLVEDLTEQYGNRAYMAGFFNRYGLEWKMEEGYNFYIVLNYETEHINVTDEVLFEVFEYGDGYHAPGSGIITLDMDSLNRAIRKAFGENKEGFENVSISFQIFDKECADSEASYIEHVLTFDRI